MSDLSNLLGDVYGDRSPDGPPVRHEASASERADELAAPAHEPATPGYEVPAPAAPAWSSESRLDRAFTGWVPGEPPQADDELAAALSAALRSEIPAPEPAPAPAPAVPVVRAPAPGPVTPPAPAAPAELPVDRAPAPRAAWAAPVNLTATAPEPALALAGVSAAPARAWMPGDDDIFPAGRRGKRKK